MVYTLIDGGAVALCSARWTPVRTVQVRVLAEDIMLCSLERDVTLMVQVHRKGTGEIMQG